MRRLLVAPVLVLVLLAPAAASAGAVAAPRFATLAFDKDCIAPDGELYVDGDCDGNGIVFTDAADLPQAGRVVISGVPFAFPAHAAMQDNVEVALGQTVPLTGRRGDRWLHVLGFSVNGTGAPDAFTVTYTDGSKTVGRLAFPDWANAAGSARNLLKHSPANPVANPVLVDTGHLFVLSVPLDPAKTARSVTLPKTFMPPALTDVGAQANAQVTPYPPSIDVMAMTLSPSPATGNRPVFH